MRVIARKNPNDCVELSSYLGYPVTEWVRHPDGSMEIDLDVTDLNPGQKQAITKKISELSTHFATEFV